MLVPFVIFILSIVLYIIAPLKYDYMFCTLCFALCLFDVFIILKSDLKKFGFFSFNTIFFFSFVFVSFIFPVMVYPTSEMLGIMSLIDTHVISKATALCQVAFSCYCLFYKIAANKYKKCLNQPLYKLPIRHNLIQKRIYLFALLAFVILIVKNISQNGFVEFTEAPYIVELYEVAFAFILITNCSSVGKMSTLHFYNLNKFPLLTASVICVVFFIIGDRGPVIIIGLTILSVYWMYVRRIRLIKLLPLLFIAVLTMFALRITRATDESLSSGGLSSFVDAASSSISGTSFIFLFSDLIYICRELYFGFEETMRNGLFHPGKIFILPFTPFPFLPTFLSDFLLGIPFDQLHSGTELNTYLSVQYGEKTSFGTHCVIDIFMSWGIIGVISFFSVFGYLMALFTYKKNKSLYIQICFVIAMYLSLYTPRDQIYAMIRPMSYGLFFVWLSYGKLLKNRL